MKPGDRVKMTEALAKTFKANSKCRTDWLTRRGRVVHVSKPTNTIVVKWDDRRTLDHWPTRALEKIS